MASIGEGSFVSPHMTLAADVVLGRNCQLTGSGFLADGVRLGDGVIIDGTVRIGAATTLGHGTIVSGTVVFGERNIIGPACVFGTPPEDPDYHGDGGSIEIGSDNVFHALFSMTMPTTTGLSRVGDGCYFMVKTHLSHDVAIGCGVKFAGNVTLAGFVRVDDFTYIGMQAAVHQRVHIGAHCMVGMNSAVMKHVPPYATLVNQRFTKVNRRGLRLRGFPEKAIKDIENRYGFISSCEDRPAGTGPEIKEIGRFVAEHSAARVYWSDPMRARAEQVAER